MTRIEKKFQECKKNGTIAFMPFLVAGDPDMKTSLAIADVVLQYADMLEIGFPYSDPLADGPTIQAANNRALLKGISTLKAFAYIRAIRKKTAIPITVLVYANLVYQEGINEFYREAKRSGVDGVLIPDVPIEEAPPYLKAASKAGIDPIFLVAQTTTATRLKMILPYAKGYLYLVSILGVTGKRATLTNETLSLIARVKENTTLPLVVGFGISKREHIHALHRAGAKGAIVGSALIKVIEKNLGDIENLLKELSLYLKQLVGY